MSNDPAAAHRADQIVRDLLDRAANGRYDIGIESATKAITAAHNAQYERENGLRRVVLRGEWEVDPAAVRERSLSKVTA